MKVRILTPLKIEQYIDEPGDFSSFSIDTLKALDGRRYEDEQFTDYLEEPYSEMSIEGGRLALQFDEQSGSVVAYADFTFPGELSESELDGFKMDINGQMTDGMGSNFFQELGDELDADVEVAGLYDSDKKSIYVILS